MQTTAVSSNLFRVRNRGFVLHLTHIMFDIMKELASSLLVLGL